MSPARKSWKRHWMPLTVILIGMISINPLYTLHRINVHQHENTILNNAILHMKVDAATFHLRTDELASGEAGVAIKDAIAGMDKTIFLADAILKGNTIDAEKGSVSGLVGTCEIICVSGENR